MLRIKRLIWSKVPQGPPDPILGITEAFKRSTNPKKINLGVGAYRDDQGKPFVLNCVKQAEAQLDKVYKDKEYLPIIGLKEFISASVLLAYGKEPKHIAATQSLSGTGALRLGAEFINRFLKGKTVFLPTPTWGNHPNIFKDCSVPLKQYRYFDKSTNSLDLKGLLEDLTINATKDDVVLLHACAHNPTGVDPTLDQWKQIEKVVKEKELLVFFDMAYQGFASGLPNKDNEAVRLFVEKGHKILLAQSFAKNFGLYGERAGLLSILCNSEEQVNAVESQLKIIIRPMYSNPPSTGARIVAQVLNTPELKELWLQEVRQMADRIIKMREMLYNNLLDLGSKHNWKHIKDQIGMFCYTGMTKEQVKRLEEEFAVFLTADGRISIAGINSGNVGYLAQSMHSVTK